MQENWKVMFSSRKIQERIDELGKTIAEDYKDKDLVMLCILKGAFVFMADLVRAIDIPVVCDFMRIGSYGSQKVSSGKVDLVLDVTPERVKGKHLLLVEDIVDTGNSIVFLKKHLAQYEPADIKVCSMLLKEAKLENDVKVDYLGFNIDPEFVIGYGLDLDEKYRNLPDIVIHPS